MSATLPNSRDPQGDRSDTVSYTPYLPNVSRARQRVAWLAKEWGVPHLMDDAALLASELCSNALLHGCVRDRLFRVDVALRNGAFRVSVTDAKGERMPVLRQPGEERDDIGQFGRGLLLVSAIAQRWDSEPLIVGKTVWAELDA
ncbi:ATP-binding protein [Streptomyces tsukubensis]|uniref:Histidine kinase/HSP90-like ATPase domain-containing protein n=1 Tax=Streptomyces tsukubensis TaxID=83656 RepID=A0A1V4A2J6_9ACTN|nr:ATP-binding protein [Streptomyces tsukubensis]OON72914.1 hypothetical protein B1H18_28310 [Streptomyces tsukubensis]QFR94484.1 ATP-binding protein [Streptomyces tsukubensis]